MHMGVMTFSFFGFKISKGVCFPEILINFFGLLGEVLVEIWKRL